jgi:hypothetical protein
MEAIMASGGTRIFNGSIAGTGAALDVTTPGFKPRRVDLFNEGGLCGAVWSDSMKDGECIKQVTDGTMSKVTTNGVTPLSTGFRLGTDADLNVSGEKVHFTAHE